MDKSKNGTSHGSMDDAIFLHETSETKKLRREFRKYQVELLELSAVGLGYQLQQTCQKLDTEWNCLKMMDSLNLNLSNHSLHHGSAPVMSSSRRRLPRRALSTPEKMREKSALPLLQRSSAVFPATDSSGLSLMEQPKANYQA
jgi:hypothetical protein